MKELVTVLLPTYNGRKYIEQMLDSIYMQDYRPLEVIIADDASNDSTVSVITNWLKNKNTQDISFKFIKNTKNKGINVNTSRAAKYIHGKYFLFADQDDIWKKDKISAQVAYLRENEDCSVCVCDRSIMNEKNEIVCKSVFQYKHADIRKRDYKKVLLSRPLSPANCMCLRAEHLDKIFPIPAQICFHDAFVTIMAAHYGRVGYLNKALTLYRIHGNNLSRQYALEMNRNLMKAWFIIVGNYKRINAKNVIDRMIVEKELKRRFNEKEPRFGEKLYSGKINNVYVKSLQYMISNLSRWKKFCG